jgi:hypothetical protein
MSGMRSKEVYTPAYQEEPRALHQTKHDKGNIPLLRIWMFEMN